MSSQSAISKLEDELSNLEDSILSSPDFNEYFNSSIVNKVDSQYAEKISEEYFSPFLMDEEFRIVLP